MAALQLEKTPAKEANVTAAASEEWPAGMRVMAVDDDRICLRILEVMLQTHKYNVTKVTDAKTALRMLREKKGWYNLVITDLHMPEMDGFELLRQIGLEMDLPVIMLSANDDTETVMKGIRYGACDYLVKPIHVEQLKHIWQHVLRRKPEAWNHKNSENVDADQRVQAGIAEGEQGAKNPRKNSRKKRNDGDHSDESKENSSKKPRVSWSWELHGQFLDAVNQIGIDKAGPKKIFDMMNVDHVSRESVGSHLQKYKIFLKRLAEDPKWKSDNELCDAARRWKMSNMELFEHFHEDQICRRPSSVVSSSSSNNHLTSQTIQPLGMGTVSHGGSMPKDASASARATGYGSHAKTLCDMLLEANQVTASSHLVNPAAKIPNSGLYAPFPVQPAPVNHSSAMMNAPATNLVGALGVGDTPKFPGLVGNYNNTWQTLVLPSKFPDLLPIDGTSAGPSRVNNLSQINQLASSRQIPMIRNEMQNLMAASNSNTSSSVVGFNQQMSTFNNIASNTSSFEMLNGNFAPSSTSSISFPTIQTSNSVSFPNLAPGSTSGISFPNMQTSNSVSFPNLASGSTSGFSFPNIHTSNSVSFPNLAPGSTSGISYPNLPTGSSVTPTQQMVNGVSMSFPDLQTCTSVTPTQMVNGASISSTLPNIQPGNYIMLDQIVNGLKNCSTLPNIETDSSAAPTQMLNGGDAVPNIQTGNYITLDQIVNGLRNSSTLPSIEAESSVAPAQMLNGAPMLNGGDAVGILPAQEGTADQQALDGQLNKNDDFSWDDIDVDMFDQNLTIDDVLFNE